MTKEDIKDLAHLCRLELNDEEIEQYQKDFEGILDYINIINTLKVTEYDNQTKSIPINIVREDDDAYVPGSYTKALLDASPEKDGDYMKVKKIL